ncbi:hypothetical protein GCM10018980_14820 [Streptomyces capoamus]|uniref:Uncharacterized protein n=1 Tax=Streptomyces capoamus TaxID=68183 RepID=A0A919C2U6_9ACTN|nr:hypothetical protein GCM10010501_19690 [Streptomyces libani subsp. rufus]GHG40499.1 hypothetical protein GCM10018980_14820 [Streptomyces capoamus]
MADQALPREIDERLECFGDRAGPGAVGVAHAQVDQVERLDAEGCEVLIDLLAQVLGAPGHGPATLCRLRQWAQTNMDQVLANREEHDASL